MPVQLKHRNIAAFPLLQNQLSYTEEEIRFLYAKQKWSKNLSPEIRLSQHHTLASARRIVIQDMHPDVPRDRLDLALSSHLRNGSCSFVNLNQFYSQPETMGEVTWKVFRNNIPAPFRTSYKFKHPLHITGANEKNLAHKVYLDATLEHSVLTGPNFRRRTDGGFFRV